jgi:hypothetical protein
LPVNFGFSGMEKDGAKLLTVVVAANSQIPPSAAVPKIIRPAKASREFRRRREGFGNEETLSNVSISSAMILVTQSFCQSRTRDHVHFR